MTLRRSCVQTRSADLGLRHECTTALDDAAAAGLTVVRCWAFCDGAQWNALQVSPARFAGASGTAGAPARQLSPSPLPAPSAATPRAV